MTFKKKWLTILVIVLATLLTAKFALATHSSPATASSNAVVGVEFVYQIPVTPSGDYEYTKSSTFGALVPNVLIMEFKWTPTAADVGISTVVFTISSDDPDVHPVSHTLTINVAAQAPSFTISEVLFEDANRGTPITKTITITNTGNVPLTGITATHDVLISRFTPTASPLTVTPSTIPVGGTATATLTLTIPETEDTDVQTIGTLTVDTAQTDPAKTAPITIEVRSGLVIGRIEINGKTSGDLSVEDVNEITVEVENVLDDQTIEDVEVTLEIDDLDVDESEEVDDDNSEIKDNDSEEVTFEFDLSDEDVDEDDYEIVITVEGVDEEGVKHTAEERKTVSVDRDRHRVSITSVSVNPETLSSSLGEQSVRVEVEIQNVGENDEDDVEIRLKNSELGIDERRDNIELDDFSGSDNDYQTTFEFQVDEDVTSGTKRILVEVYRDGTLDDTEEVTLTVPQRNGQTTNGNSDEPTDIDALIEQIRAELEESIQNQETPTNVPLRQSSSYVALLSVLTVLLIIAVLLGLVILLVRKPKAPPVSARESKK